jgi:hypothetical protein
LKLGMTVSEPGRRYKSSSLSSSMVGFICESIQ